MSDSIKVAIKVRPLIKREKDENLTVQWVVQGNSIISTDPELKKRGDGGYHFDHIFDMDATNSIVFNTIVKPIVDAAVNGFNGTVFAYGQTSSGKTYTMMGTPEEPGIIPLAIQHMFEAISSTAGREFLLRVSYLEIYKEKVNDLLNKTGVDLKLHEDNGQVFVKCKEEITNCPENLLSIMKKGDKNRRIAETNMNERSSRSHSIFRITIESREAGADSNGAIQVSQLNLVDLAGSERARQTGATGERFQEGRHINLSLSTLGLVIMQLSSESQEKFANFRDSKLTRLLQASLGGNAMTAIICAVTPAALEESQCTLSFASRAKSVKNKPQINEVMSDAALLKRYAKQLAKLNAELEKIKSENRLAEVEEMESKLQEKDRINQLLEERIELLKTRIVSGDNTIPDESFKCKSKRRQTWGGPGAYKQHVPVFQPKPTLPTIKEISPEKPHKSRNSISRSRKSIIQTVDIMNQTFQTAFADFELELIESERDRDMLENVSDVMENASDSDDEMFIMKHKPGQRVTFRDEIQFCKSQDDTVDTTPEKKNASIQTFIEQASPSTPKNVLRKSIMKLSQDLDELREFTILEKQLICEEHCNEQKKDVQELPESSEQLESKVNDVRSDLKDDPLTTVLKKLEDLPEVNELLNLDVKNENDLERLVTQLCMQLKEAKKENTLRETTNRESFKTIEQLEQRVKNLTSERDEFEYISGELRSKLTKSTLALQVKNEELESRIEDLVSKNAEYERVSTNLRTELELKGTIEKREADKKIFELEEQVQNLTSERDEYRHIGDELRVKLGITTLEYDVEKEKVQEEVTKLKKHVENLISEKNEYERINVKLHPELSEQSPQLESNTALEDVTRNNADLQKQVESLVTEKNELECSNAELRNQLQEKSSELECEKTMVLNARTQITELEKALESLNSETNELKRTNIESEKKSECLVIERNDFERANTELRTELNHKISELEETKVVKQEALEKVSPLEEQVETLIREKNEYEQTTVKLQAELNSVCLETETAISQAKTLTAENNELKQSTDELRAQLMIKNSELDEGRAENRQALDKIAELEKQVETFVAENEELKRIHTELQTNLIAKNTESEESRNAYQQAMDKVSELEKRLEILDAERKEYERSNSESQGESTAISSEAKEEKLENPETNRILELEKQIEQLITERNELGHIKDKLSTEVEKKITEFEEQRTASEKAVEEISALRKELEALVSDGDKLRCINDELRTDTSRKSVDSTPIDDYDYVTENKNLKHQVHDLQEMLNNIQAENRSLEEQFSKHFALLHPELNESGDDPTKLILCLEDDKVKLSSDLEMKIQELEEIKNDVQSLKLDIEKLQKTIFLLTTENMDMSTKLSLEKERSRENEINLQKTIDELYARMSKITDEKLHLQSDLANLTEQLETTRSKIQNDEVHKNEDEVVQYRNKIDKLTAENIELSASIVEKNKELESIKESKSLLYDHECLYKDKVTALTSNNNSLVLENSELSTDLMDKIEEIETLKEECDKLKTKLEFSLVNHVSNEQNDHEDLRKENGVLKAEIMELKTRVTMLSDENTKISDNLLETMEELDISRNDKSANTTLHLSTMFDNTMKVDETVEEILHEENREILANKVIMLQDKINHLTRLNKKLSDLKLTSCSQCAHIRNLNESRRALKLETKKLSHRLKELQKKFDQKCADAEALKIKANQEVNLSMCDTSLNSSFLDGMNVSFVEERVQVFNNELQTLKDDHEKLSLLYNEKCNEFEKLYDDTVSDSHQEGNSKSKKPSNKKEPRFEQIQKNIDQVRDDIDQMKKDSSGFNSVINKFRIEKEALMEEINMLKSINEDLQQRVSDNETSAATATEKAQILEIEITNLSKEIEEFTAREKLITSEKLNLEVALEDIKADREAKNTLISGLHKTIDELNERLSSAKNELDLMTSQKNELIAFTETMECKYKGELEIMTKQYKEMENEKIQCAEAEKRATLWAKELEADIEKLQVELSQQETGHNKDQAKVSELEHLLNDCSRERDVLQQKLTELQMKLVTASNTQTAHKYKEELEIVSQKFDEYKKETETEINLLTEKVRKYIEENENLIQELTKSRISEEKFKKMQDENEDRYSEEKRLDDDNKKLTDEVNNVKECMIKELKSLRYKVNTIEFVKKPVKEIFLTFLQALLSKEEEVVKAMRAQLEKDKQKLTDQTRQSADAEKRALSWAKELEAEIEKLQVDLTNRESIHHEHQDKISQLEHLLKESNHEKEMLKEKIETLESDFNNLQYEFDTRYKMDVVQEEAVSIAQKREKEAQQAFRNKEMELQSKIKSEKERYEKRIEDLISTIELYKTKNLELKSNIEGLEVNEKQLKNLIEANAADLKKSNQNLQKMDNEMEQLTQAYNELNCEIEKKNSRVEEITVLLKDKCDVLSEYKSKLELITPDYELLQEQVRERKTSIERYKEEIDALRLDREKQIEIIQDKLSSEEIKNAGLTKQLNEMNNKNISLIAELDDLKEKYEELRQENAKLGRKIRNSTSKLKAEAEMEDLRDLNKRLQNNLDGASNRITELQENKKQMLKELVSLKSQYDLVSQENVELQKCVASYKSKPTIATYSADGDKYDALLQEKNKIALELEGKKLILNQKDKEIEKYKKQVVELTDKNKELDDELEEYAAVIRDRDAENARLEDKLYSYLTGNKVYCDLEEKVKALREENEKLEEQLGATKTRSRIEKKKSEDILTQNEKLSKEIKMLDALRKENVELQSKIVDLENKLELRSNSSGSRCASPAFETARRRHSRNEVFNQRRQLENIVVDIEPSENDQKCQMLRKKIYDLELQLVNKNGKIATLEMQIQSENFPYQRKCKDLEEQLLAYRNKNTELNLEIRKLQRAMNEDKAWECDICRNWRVNRRHQSCQTIPDTTIRFCSTSSGVVEEHVKIQKLEKEHKIMKELCRSRSRQIKELEERIKQFEDLQSTPVLRSIEPFQGRSNQQHIPLTYSDRQFNLEKNIRPTLKENIPANLLEGPRSMSHRTRLRDDNQF